MCTIYQLRLYLHELGRGECEALGICAAGMCEEQRTTGTSGVVVGCETLKRN